MQLRERTTMRPAVARLAVVGAVVAAIAATVLAMPAGPVAADTLLEVEFMPTPGPIGPITVIGDSVLLGSALWAPTLVDRLTERGWGPIQFRAGVGYQTGYFSNKAAIKASYWIQRWRSEGWDPANVFVNIGANDSVACSNAECAYQAIKYLVDTIGPGHRIWWPKITGLTTHQVDWNVALDRMVSERPGVVFTWNWPTVMATGGFTTNDFTHLDAPGYRLRSLLMAREATADLATTSRVGGDASIPPAIAAPAEFVPLAPRRILDTRDGGGPPVAAGGHVDIDMTADVPPGTTAVAVGLTTDRSAAPGFLTGYPCDRPRKEVSNVNHAAGAPRGALAVVPLSADGHLCVYTRAQGHVIVDLQGAFVPDDDSDRVDGTRFSPLDPPDRLLDTRDTGRSAIVVVAVPAGAEAVAVNLTATGVTGSGWLKAYPCGDMPPVVSNVNFLAGDTVAGAAFVPVSAQGTICVQSLVPADVIVDITGTFASDGALRFVPTDPTRLLDTRSGLGGWGPILAGGLAIDIAAVPAGAKAATGTLTLVAPLRAGWLKAYPCGDVPPTSNVNGPIDAVFANAVTVGVDPNGRMCILSLQATHTLFDLTGWWTP